MTTRLKTFFLLLPLLVMGNMVIGQDAHFSQFDAMPVLISPANTGMVGSGSDMRIGVLYRNQWASLATSFTTFAMSFDMPFGERFGIGAYFKNVDAANVINTSSFVLSGAYSITNPRNSKYRISTGLQLGVLYKRLNTNNMIFDSQFDGNNFDNSLPTGEMFDRMARVMPDVSVGIAYENTNKSNIVKPYAAGSIFHITSPNESFAATEQSRLPLRWLAHAGARIEVNEELMIDPQMLFQMQRASTEINFGGLAHYNISGTGYHAIGGAFYRWGDAAVVHLGLKHNFNIFRISYDFNTSQLVQFSKTRGAIEFSVLYQPGKRRSRAVY